MRNNPMREDIVPFFAEIEKRLRTLEQRSIGSVYVTETIIARDPKTGVETWFGNIPSDFADVPGNELGEGSYGLKQWVNDVTPPPVPSSPMVSSGLGVISIAWDGANANNETQAPDFSHLNVYGSDGTSSLKVGVVRSSSEVAIFADAGYDTPWVFWFTAVDQNGNESLESAESEPHVLTPLVNAPDISGAITEIYEKMQEDFTKAMDSADGKNSLWHTPTAPVPSAEKPFKAGDTWFDVSNGNKIHKWNPLPAPGAWEAVVLDSEALDNKVTQMIEDAKADSQTAIVSASGKNSIWYRTTAPSGTNHKIGDTWFDTANGNRINTWNGTIWETIELDLDSLSDTVTQAIVDAQNQADTALSAANGKNSIWHSPTAPVAAVGSPHKNGDTWFNTSKSNQISVWDGTKWELVITGADGLTPEVIQSISNAQQAAAAARQIADQLVLDLATTEEDFDTKITATNQSVIAAQAAAGAAQGTADSALTMAGTKSNVYYSTAVATGTGSRIDDIWRQRNASDEIIGEWRWTGTKWQNITLTTGVFSNLDAGLLTAGTIQADRIGARSITAEKIKAKELTANEIKAGSITSASGVFGTIDASSINAGTLNAARLNAADIRAKFLAAGKITADDIVTGTITAASGVIGSLDASKITTGELEGKYIKAGTIATDKLVVADANNYSILDPQRNIDVTYPPEWATINDGEWSKTKPGTQTYIMFRDRSGPIPFKSGDKIRVMFTSKSTVATSASLNIWCYPSADVTAGSRAGASISVTIPVASTDHSYVLTVPDITPILGSGAWVVGLSGTGTNTTSLKNVFVLKMTGTVLIEDGAVTADQIKGKTITAAEMEAGTITATSGIIGSLDAGKITVGEMDGKFIKGGTILAKTLAINDFTNYIPNLNSQADEWTLSSGVAITTSTLSPEGKRITFPVSALAQARTPKIGVSPGEKIKITLSTYATSATNELEICWFGYNGTGASAGSGVIYKHSSTSSTVPAQTWTVPSTVAQVEFNVRVPSVANTVSVGAYNFTARKMTGTVLIEEGAVTANEMKTGTITADSGIIGSLNAGVIVAGTVEGKHIKSKTISVDRLLVGSTDNLILDPQFTNNGLDWAAPNTIYTYPVGEGRDGVQSALRIAPSASQVGRYSGRIPAKQGDSFRVSVWVKSNVAIPAGVLAIYSNLTRGTSSVPGYASNFLKQADGTSTGNDPIPANTWTKISGKQDLAAYDDTTSVAFGFYVQSSFSTGTVWYSDAEAYRMADGQLVVDGSILASHIAADQVEAQHIKSNAITADKILAGSIDATKMTIGGIGAGVNIVPNWQLADLTGWSGWGRNSSNGPEGQASIWGLGRKNLTSSPFPVEGGMKYRVSVTAMGQNSGSRMYVQVNTNGTGNPYAITNVILQAGGWLTFEGEVLIPIDATTAYFNVYLNHPNGSNTTGYQWYTKWIMSPMVDGQLIVNGAIDGKTITGSTIQTDKADYIGLKMDNSGLRVYEEVLEGTPNSETAVSTEFRPDGLTKIGIYGTADGTKQYLAGMSADGDVTGQALSISGNSRMDGPVVMGGDPLSSGHGSGDYGPVVNGRDLLGATFSEYVDDHPNVTNGNAWMTVLPHGVVVNTAREETTPITFDGIGGRDHQRMRLGAWHDFTSGRMYSITYRTPAVNISGAGAGGAALLRYSATDTGIVAGGGSVIRGSRVYLEAGAWPTANTTTYLRCPEDVPSGRRQVGIEMYVYSGRTASTIGTDDSSRWELTIVDMGMRRSSFNGNNLDSKVQGTATIETPPPPPPPAPKQYTSTFNYSWHKNFETDGSAYVSSSMGGKATFGMSPYYTTGGTKRSHIGFSGNISGTLSGSTVKKVEVYIYTEHWHYSGGGTLNIGYHNNSSAPSTSAVTSSNVVQWEAKSQAMKKPEGRWITLPLDSMWKAGTIKGIILRPPGNSSSASYYGYATANKTKLRITYTK